MKAVTTEQIRTMRDSYATIRGKDKPIVQMLNELLEYREAEEQAGEEPSPAAVKSWLEYANFDDLQTSLGPAAIALIDEELKKVGVL